MPVQIYYGGLERLSLALWEQRFKSIFGARLFGHFEGVLPVVLSRTQLLTMSTWLCHLFGHKVPPTTGDSTEVYIAIFTPKTADTAGV